MGRYPKILTSFIKIGVAFGFKYQKLAENKCHI